MAKFLYNQEAVENLRLSDTSILDRLIDFDSARAAHLKKDHAKKDKRMSLPEAISPWTRKRPSQQLGRLWAHRAGLNNSFPERLALRGPFCLSGVTRALPHNARHARPATAAPGAWPELSRQRLSRLAVAARRLHAARSRRSCAG